jgi:type I thyroxine 5'-deiodinase
MATPDGAVMEEPRTLAEREDHANHCMGALDLAPMTALVDDMEDTAIRLYEAWPDRLILVDRNGRVAYRSGPGPFGFDVEQFERAIERELSVENGAARAGG